MDDLDGYGRSSALMCVIVCKVDKPVKQWDTQAGSIAFCCPRTHPCPFRLVSCSISVTFAAYISCLSTLNEYKWNASGNSNIRTPRVLFMTVHIYMFRTPHETWSEPRNSYIMMTCLLAIDGRLECRPPVICTAVSFYSGRLDDGVVNRLPTNQI